MSGHSHSHSHSHSDSHSHSHSHSHSYSSDDDHIAPVPTSSAQSLWGKIDHPHITALNMANASDDIQKIFKREEDKYCAKPVVRSDCDAQLIIHVPFVNVSVKLCSLILRTNGGSYCPRTIRLWKNDLLIDFDTATAKKPTFTIHHPHVGLADDDELPDIVTSDAEFVEHHLPRHVFLGVHHLTIFIEDVYGNEDELHINNIELRGEFSELTRDPVITLYELAANPADHKNLAVAESLNYSAI